MEYLIDTNWTTAFTSLCFLLITSLYNRKVTALKNVLKHTIIFSLERSQAQPKVLQVGGDKMLHTQRVTNVGVALIVHQHNILLMIINQLNEPISNSTADVTPVCIPQIYLCYTQGSNNTTICS